MLTHDELDPISLQLKQVDDDLAYLRDELHPYYPDNSSAPRSTPDELFELAASMVREAEKLRDLIEQILVEPELDIEPLSATDDATEMAWAGGEHAFYDTTTEMHDDLGTFDPSPRD